METTTSSDAVVIALAIIAFLTALVNTIVGAIVIIMTQETKHEVLNVVNGQKHELVAEVRAASRAIGVAAGASGELPGDAEILTPSSVQ